MSDSNDILSNPQNDDLVLPYLCLGDTLSPNLSVGPTLVFSTVGTLAKGDGRKNESQNKKRGRGREHKSYEPGRGKSIPDVDASLG